MRREYSSNWLERQIVDLNVARFESGYSRMKKFRDYTEEDFASLEDGVYFCQYDPNMKTDFWPPNDEEVKIFGNRLKCSAGIWCMNSVSSILTFLRDLTKDEIRQLKIETRRYK